MMNAIQSMVAQIQGKLPKPKMQSEIDIRRLEIQIMAAQGLSLRQIAERLGISHVSVSRHLKGKK